MRKKFIVRLSVLFCLVAMAACRQKPKANHHDLGKIEVDSALAALINPTDEKIVARVATVTPEEKAGASLVEVQGMVSYDSRNEQYLSSKVAGRIERLYVKFNYQPLKKGQLVMEIYAPDLAMAQQELIYLSQHNEDAGLLQKAKQRLLLLGMPSERINQVLRSKKVDYRIPVYSPADGYVVESTLPAPTSAAVVQPQTSAATMDGMGLVGPVASTAPSVASIENTPVSVVEGQYVTAGQSLFKIYQTNTLVAEFAIRPSLLPFVTKGTKLALYNANDREETFQTARVALLQPMVKNGEAFSVAKVYLSGKSHSVGALLVAKIPVVLAKSHWLPNSAVIIKGKTATVFKAENGVFVPKQVQVGLSFADKIQVLTPIATWKVAKDAAYLVDSESFIQAK